MASQTLKGITIKINGETTGLNSALDKVDSQSRGLAKNLRQVETLLKYDPNNTELLAQREKYAAEQAKLLADRVEHVTTALKGVEKGTAAYDELQRQLVKSTSQMEALNAKAETAHKTLMYVQNGGTNAADGLGKAANAASSFGSALEQVASGAAMAVGSDLVSAASSLVSAAAETAIAWDSADAKIAAATGSAAGYAEQMSSTLRELYADGWGDSIEGLTETAVKAREVLGELNGQDLSAVITSVETMESVFGSDVAESLRGVNVLMEKFGLSATEACDLMMSGMQRGLDYTDELGDNLSEYAGRWAEAGMSATEYFSLLQAGVDAGAYSLDKVGDYLNELLTSLSDGRMSVWEFWMRLPFCTQIDMHEKPASHKVPGKRRALFYARHRLRVFCVQMSILIQNLALRGVELAGYQSKHAPRGVVVPGGVNRSDPRGVLRCRATNQRLSRRMQAPRLPARSALTMRRTSTATRPRALSARGRACGCGTATAPLHCHAAVLPPYRATPARTPAWRARWRPRRCPGRAWRRSGRPRGRRSSSRPGCRRRCTCRGRWSRTRRR